MWWFKLLIRFLEVRIFLEPFGTDLSLHGAPSFPFGFESFDEDTAVMLQFQVAAYAVVLVGGEFFAELLIRLK